MGMVFCSCEKRCSFSFLKHDATAKDVTAYVSQFAASADVVDATVLQP